MDGLAEIHTQTYITIYVCRPQDISQQTTIYSIIYPYNSRHVNMYEHILLWLAISL